MPRKPDCRRTSRARRSGSPRAATDNAPSATTPDSAQQPATWTPRRAVRRDGRLAESCAKPVARPGQATATHSAPNAPCGLPEDGQVIEPVAAVGEQQRRAGDCRIVSEIEVSWASFVVAMSHRSSAGNQRVPSTEATTAAMYRPRQRGTNSAAITARLAWRRECSRLSHVSGGEVGVGDPGVERVLECSPGAGER